MLHRARDLLMRQRTQVINALRAHLAEFGITAAQGREGIKELLAIVAQEEGSRLPSDAHASLTVLATQLQAVQTMIGSLEKRFVRSIARTKQVSGSRPSPALDFLGPLRSQRSSQIRGFFALAVILRPGSGSCRGKIRPVANRSSGRSRNRATNTSGAFSLSELMPSCGVRDSSQDVSLLTLFLASAVQGRPVALANRWRDRLGVADQGRTYRAPQLVAA